MGNVELHKNKMSTYQDGDTKIEAVGVLRGATGGTPWIGEEGKRGHTYQ